MDISIIQIIGTNIFLSYYLFDSTEKISYIIYVFIW